MKKALILLLLAVFGLGTANHASAQIKIGTVDMKKVFENYYKTKDAEQHINDARNEAKKELEDRMDAYKKAMDEVRKLDDEIKKPELSNEAKQAKAKLRDEKSADINVMEREIKEFQNNRQHQLEEQSVRMRSGIVDEIQKVIADRVKSEQYDLVFDSSGPSLNGVPVVLYCKPSYDFTPEVVSTLNKNRPKEEPAAAETPSTPKPAAGGKKKP